MRFLFASSPLNPIPGVQAVAAILVISGLAMIPATSAWGVGDSPSNKSDAVVRSSGNQTRVHSREELTQAAKEAFAKAEQLDRDPDLSPEQKCSIWQEYIRSHPRAAYRMQRAYDRRNHWAQWKTSRPEPKKIPQSPPGSTPVASPGNARELPAQPSPSRPAAHPLASGATKTLDLGNGITMNLVLVRGGTFLMGAPENEKGYVNKEGPKTRVTITGDFWLGETEVTQEQYAAVMDANPSHFKGKGKLPVEQVSFNEASEFCAELSKRAGMRITLPTEAQWEYACKAGTSTRFCFGDQEESLGQYAWYQANSDSRTHPVKSRKPNSLGLYDMHGNVREWCLDKFTFHLPGGSAFDPVAICNSTMNMERGGCYHSHPAECRSAFRGGAYTDGRNMDLGFRVAAACEDK